MDSISESRLDQVAPQLASRIRRMSEMLKDEFTFRVTQGLRSWDEQEKLYATGRDADGNKIGATVTNARGGHSWHNFGLAVDLVPDIIAEPGFQPDWNETHPTWKRMIAVGESLGLASGSKWRTFPDWPHFQLTGVFPVSPDDEVRQTFIDGGMQAVWEAAQLPQLS